MSPEVIVLTYPGYGHLLEHLSSRGSVHGAKVMVVVTDSLSINSAWYRPPSDLLLVANRETADVIARAGISPGRIRVTGFPVPAAFRQPLDRADGPPWEVLYMVNSAHHRAPEIVKALLGVSGIRLTVTAGRDEKLASAVRDLSARMGIPVSVFGWTPQIGELLRRSHILISKAGGATVQEALAARTPMIITQIVPGQEEGNATLMMDCGAGEFAGTAGTIAAAVAGMTFGGGALYRRRRDAAAAISRPDAAEAVAECIEEIIR
jgi:processive 1,2-diacylglycerol beta-glucosyltransferase